MVSALTVPMLMAVVLVSTLVCGHQQGSEDQPGEKHGGSTGQQPGGKGSSQSDRSGAARALNQNYGGGGAEGNGAQRGSSNQKYGGGGAEGNGAQRGSSNQKYGGGGNSQDDSGSYVGRIYTDPEYYGYESTFPGGRANFKAYRSEHGNERSGQDQSGGRNSQEQGRKSPGGTHGRQQQQQQQQQRY